MAKAGQVTKGFVKGQGRWEFILSWGLKASALWFLKTSVSVLWKEDCIKVGDPLWGALAIAWGQIVALELRGIQGGHPGRNTVDP